MVNLCSGLEKKGNQNSSINIALQPLLSLPRSSLRGAKQFELEGPVRMSWAIRNAKTELLFDTNEYLFVSKHWLLKLFFQRGDSIEALLNEWDMDQE